MSKRLATVCGLVALLITPSPLRASDDTKLPVPRTIHGEVVQFVIFFSALRFPSGQHKVVPVVDGKADKPTHFTPKYYCLMDSSYQDLKCGPGE